MLKQQLQTKLSQKLSPQQIQLMKLIQLSTLDLEQRIQSEIGENPALEKGKELNDSELEINDPYDDYQNDQKIDTEDIDIDTYLSDDEVPNYKIQSNNQSGDDENREIPFSGGASFHEYLESQLQNLILSAEERPIAEFLIGSIDNSGYLRRSEEDILDDLAFTQNIIVQPFGKEKIEYIKDSYVKSLISKGPMQCIPNLLKAIHFDTGHKENLNVSFPICVMVRARRSMIEIHMRGL